MKTIDPDLSVQIFPPVQRQEVIQDHLQRYPVEGVIGLTGHTLIDQSMVTLVQSKNNKEIQVNHIKMGSHANPPGATVGTV
jgi:hypothetical protein